MKSIIIDKIILMASTVGMLYLITPSDTIKSPLKIQDRKEVVNISTSGIKKSPDTISKDSIIADAKRTIEAYNNSVERKNRITKLMYNLTKKELANAEKTNKLITELTNKYRRKSLSNTNTNDENFISDLKIDSVCTKQTNYLFGKNKCAEWNLTLYLYKGKNKEKVVLQEIKTKP